MGELKTILSEKRDEISVVLDKLFKTSRDIIVQKNNKIHFLNEEINNLNNIANKNRNRKSIFLPNLNTDELISKKQNNKFLKFILKQQIRIKKLKRELLKNNEISQFNPRDMSAFRIIAIKLEEKEDIIKKNNKTIEELQANNKILSENLTIKANENNSLKDEIEKLSIENLNLDKNNLLNCETIKTLAEELKNKNLKVVELKNYFMEILDNYNDILQRIE